jgi:HlyD family secretion protein
VDRPIENVVRRRALIRRAAIAAAALLAAILGLSWGADWLRPSVARSRVRIERVDAGPIEASITAAGLVVPGRV